MRAWIVGAASLSVIALANTPSVARAGAASALNALQARLQSACPAKKLSQLPPADLETSFESFEGSLGPASAKAISDEVGRRQAAGACGKDQIGLTCGNSVTAQIFQRRKLTPLYISFTCASSLKCTGPATCSATNE